MAAYAALVSVMHIIETIQKHPRPPISFDKEQLQSLIENVTLLQEFLETHSIDDDGLESRIADAAYAAEDVIESHVVDQTEDFYDGLHKVIKDMALILTDVSSFAKKTGIKDDDDDQHNDYSSRGSHSSTGQDTAVGFDDVLVEVMNKLTLQQSNRQIIPIVGMGGIGKTTLATNIYVNPVIVQYFDFRGWATISQEYNSKEIILEVLVGLNMGSTENLSKMSEDGLGVKLHKSLCGRRYLIVLDDIWSMEAWDRVKTFFPDNNNGSAIILTTRLSNLASQLSCSCFEMSFLSEDKSWNLFCKITFGEENCPPELEGIGKKIVGNCRGLPLSIVAVGGILAKSKRTREYWLYIYGNLNSIVNLEDNERCLKILHLSYTELPVHLKPCFLYMGVYPEDWVIDVAELMRLWVAEGFLKPISGKCLETVAKEYFSDLIGRNLILVNERGYTGETIKCKVHDLFVDVCVREAKKHKFLCIASHHNFKDPQDLNVQRRIVVHNDTMTEFIHTLPSHGSIVRSLTCKYPGRLATSLNFRLLRVYNVFDKSSPYKRMHFVENTHGIVNCRYISGLSMNSANSTLDSTLPPSIMSLWNLQTLNILTLDVSDLSRTVSTSEIWKMTQLRHVHFDQLNLLDPPPSDHTDGGGDDYFVLGNLQTLRNVNNFKFSDDVVKRIPNIKELTVSYGGIEDWSNYCLNNLVQLVNLESLYFGIPYLRTPTPSLTFPCSLKELSLNGTKLEWGDLGTNIGSLPDLQVLELYSMAFMGTEWETVEGQFRSLKYLKISDTDLMYWRTESWTHFPCLERLFLEDLEKLEEIPSEIGETLRSIEILHCSDSAVFSAKEILSEQEGLGNEGLQVVERLAAPTFGLDLYTLDWLAPLDGL